MAADSPYFDPITDDDWDAIAQYRGGFQPFADCISGIQELETIQADRAASREWNARPDAEMRRFKLNAAINALKVAATITYFETNGTPDA